MNGQLAPIMGHLEDAAPGGLIGVYLYGSATTGQLQPDSDVDLLMVTGRSLTDGERANLVALLLNVSGWKGHGESFPEAANRRPIELTSLVHDDVRPLADTPRLDFQYGEWLCTKFEAGIVPQSRIDSDLLEEYSSDQRNVLLTLARIVVTLETGDIVTKDVAAQTIVQRQLCSLRRLLPSPTKRTLGFQLFIEM
ncbi:MAG: DUF4111 domain-containing protein [Micrococcaceae bacterium]|nr:DUF4111 domain-containing protein [Micrococcaceae bacterium]